MYNTTHYVNMHQLNSFTELLLFNFIQHITSIQIWLPCLSFVIDRLLSQASSLVPGNSANDRNKRNSSLKL